MDKHIYFLQNVLFRSFHDIYVSGIYPSSFTNVRFLTKIEFLNVVKCRLGSQGTASSATGS